MVLTTTFLAAFFLATVLVTFFTAAFLAAFLTVVFRAAFLVVFLFGLDIGFLAATSGSFIFLVRVCSCAPGQPSCTCGESRKYKNPSPDCQVEQASKNAPPRSSRESCLTIPLSRGPMAPPRRRFGVVSVCTGGFEV